MRALLVALWLWPATALAHPAHVSLAEAEVVAQSLQVSLQVKSDELSRELGRFKRGASNKEGVALLQAWLKQHIQVRSAGGTLLPLKWVGVEREVFVAWLYFEVQLQGASDTHTLANTLFLDHNPAQVNTVNLKAHDGTECTLTFTVGSQQQPLSCKKSSAP